MKFNYESFTERALDSGMADEFVSTRQKNKETRIMEKLNRLTDDFTATLSSEQKKMFDIISDLEIEHESVMEAQAFYKGYMLAISFLEQ